MVGKNLRYLKISRQVDEKIYSLGRARKKETFQEEALFAFANSSSSARLSYPSIFRLGMA
jgi:hypothetical protein